MLASTMEEGGVPTMSRDHVPLIPAMEGKGNGGSSHEKRHGHSHGPPARNVLTPKTSLPSTTEMDQLPRLGCINGVKGYLGWSVRNPLPSVVITTAVLLLATSFFLTLKSLTYYKSDCLYGLIMRVLIARSIFILADVLYVHIVCYKVVRHFKIAIKFSVNQIAMLRINSKSTLSMRVVQSLLLLVPCAYFSFDRAEGCNYMCCPNEDNTEMVPEYFADYSLLCMTAAIPLVVFAVMNLFRDPVEEGWLKQNAKRMKKECGSGGGHKG
eukprot:g6738.t1